MLVLNRHLLKNPVKKKITRAFIYLINYDNDVFSIVIAIYMQILPSTERNNVSPGPVDVTAVDVTPVDVCRPKHVTEILEHKESA